MAQGGVVRLVRALLANATASPPCADDGGCGGGSACVRGRCTPGAAPTAAFVPAWSPALSYDADTATWRVNASAPDADVDPFWTESYWPRLAASLLLCESHAAEAGLFAAGVIVTAATAMAVTAARAVLQARLKAL